MARRLLAPFLGALLLFGVAAVDPASTQAIPPWACTQANDGEPVEGFGAPPGMIWECHCYFTGSGVKCNWILKKDPDEDPDAVKIVQGYTYGSASLNLCVKGQAGLISDYFGGATNAGASVAFSETYGGNCGNSYGLNKSQPAGEVRTRTYLQILSGGTWSNCTTSGFFYNGSTGSQVSSLFNMGSVPDCGTGFYYRTRTEAHVWESSAWRGGYVYTGSLFMN